MCVSYKDFHKSTVWTRSKSIGPRSKLCVSYKDFHKNRFRPSSRPRSKWPFRTRIYVRNWCAMHQIEIEPNWNCAFLTRISTEYGSTWVDSRSKFWSALGRNQIRFVSKMCVSYKDFHKSTVWTRSKSIGPKSEPGRNYSFHTRISTRIGFDPVRLKFWPRWAGVHFALKVAPRCQAKLQKWQKNDAGRFKVVLSPVWIRLVIVITLNLGCPGVPLVLVAAVSWQRRSDLWVVPSLLTPPASPVLPFACGQFRNTVSPCISYWHHWRWPRLMVSWIYHRDQSIFQKMH